MSKNRFSYVPQVRMNRTRIPLPRDIKTTMNVGRLYPIECVEVLPGDTFKCKTDVVARVSSSFLKPVLDNAYMDIFHFFVPWRLVFKDTERIFGNPNPSAYTEDDLAEIPTFETRQVVSSGSVADYLRLPIGSVPAGLSVLPFRAFALIYNHWFRNQNTVSETYVQTGELKASEMLNDNEWSPNNYTGKPPFVAKRNDYFTSALPSPQKGEPVKTAIFDDFLTLEKNPNFVQDIYVPGNGTSLLIGENAIPGSLVTSSTDVSAGSTLNVLANSANVPSTIIPTGSSISIDPRQFGIDGSNATITNVNDLRFAFQLQKYLERSARGGSRYQEYLLSAFGVMSPDARLQIPEFLGGKRIPIGVQQVAQTSAGTEESPLGDVGAFSVSAGRSRYTKGFVEHGYIITCACIRTIHTYQQGIEKMWTRKTRNDIYDPVFANLGEQPIYTSELFANADNDVKGSVFGYNEAWAEYRNTPNAVTGQMRSGVFRSLDFWHFGDYYTNAPVLSEEFTNETGKFFDRTLSVPSESLDNFICEFYFDRTATRVMPLYSVPGLIDHH